MPVSKWKTFPESSPAGLVWSETLPSHWRTKRLRHLFEVKKRIAGKLGFDVLSVTKKGLKVKDITSGGGQLAADYSTYQIVEEGDFAMNHMDLISGFVGLSTQLGVTSPDYRVFSLENNYDCKDYFLYVLEMCYLEKIFFPFGQGASQIGRWRFPSNSFRDFVFPYPPNEEQVRIARFIEKRQTEIQSMIESLEKGIELLGEKRSTLITQAVTKGLDADVELKDSGIDWIGKIPEHWSLVRVKYLINERDGIKIGPFGSSLKLSTLTETGIKIYGQGNVIKNDFDLGHRHIPVERFESDFSQYEILEGDVLITMMGTTGKSKVFKKEFKRGIIDSHLIRLRFESGQFESDLFTTILQESSYMYHQLKLRSNGSIMEGLNSSIVKDIFLVKPPINEQKEIMEYLKKKICVFEKIRTKTEIKIKKLREYRKALISAAVTGKIDVRGR